MGKSAFEGVLDKACYNKLYREMETFIEENCDNLELDGKSNFIEYIQAASLEDMEIQRVINIKQEDETLTFDVLVSCEIQIEETVSRNRDTDGVSQWFIVNCSATFDGEIKSFKVRKIDVYSR